MLTQNFKNYLKEFSMSSKDQISHSKSFCCITIYAIEYIKNNTSIFAGNKAFDIMFKASEHD